MVTGTDSGTGSGGAELCRTRMLPFIGRGEKANMVPSLATFHVGLMTLNEVENGLQVPGEMVLLPTLIPTSL